MGGRQAFPFKIDQIVFEEDGNFGIGGELGEFLQQIWVLGNIFEDSLKDVIHQMEFDPLVLVIQDDTRSLRAIALEVEKGIDKYLEDSTTPWIVISRILESPWMRLYITKRIIQELVRIGQLDQGIFDELGIDMSQESLQEEYYEGQKEFVEFMREEGNAGIRYQENDPQACGFGVYKNNGEMSEGALGERRIRRATKEELSSLGINVADDVEIYFVDPAADRKKRAPPSIWYKSDKFFLIATTQEGKIYLPSDIRYVIPFFF